MSDHEHQTFELQEPDETLKCAFRMAVAEAVDKIPLNPGVSAIIDDEGRHVVTVEEEFTADGQQYITYTDYVLSAAGELIRTQETELGSAKLLREMEPAKQALSQSQLKAAAYQAMHGGTEADAYAALATEMLHTASGAIAGQLLVNKLFADAQAEELGLNAVTASELSEVITLVRINFA